MLGQVRSAYRLCMYNLTQVDCSIRVEMVIGVQVGEGEKEMYCLHHVPIVNEAKS